MLLGYTVMKCSICGYTESKVIDSRSVDNGIRRRRQCLKCDARFTTYERVQPRNIFVIKKDGRREEFNREKLLSGILRACQKRPLPTGAVDKLVDSIEIEFYQLGKVEIPSSIIGDKVIQRLQELDQIAYIRFASVYHDFSNIISLKQAVDTLIITGDKIPPAEQLYLLSPEQLANFKKRQQIGK